MNRNSQLNFICGVLMMLALVLGCGGSSSTTTTDTPKPTATATSTPQPNVPSAYVGEWTGQDGSTVTLRNDGSGDYKSGGKSVSGGKVKVDEAAKEIKFTFLGFDAGKYKIDEPPKKNRMRLDGMEYRRTGGFDASDPDDKSSANNGGELPSADELRSLASATLEKFDAALQQDNFSELYAYASETFKGQFTVATLRQSFASVIDNKAKYKLKERAVPTFTSPPVLEDEGRTMRVEGAYPTPSGRNILFKLKYIREDGEWKLLGVRVAPETSSLN